MRQPVLLTVCSLLSILLLTVHLAQDIIFKMSPAGPTNLIATAILTVWLYGTVALPGRRAGYVIVLLASLFGFGIPIIHMLGSRGMIGGTGQSGMAFFFVWTQLALSLTTIFSVMVAAQLLWRRQPGREPAFTPSS